MTYDEQTFPVVDYTFTVEQLLFDQGTMLVKYLPTDETLTSITLNIPIWPSMDLNDIKAYTMNFAPNDRWYAQKVILNSTSQLMGGA